MKTKMSLLIILFSYWLPTASQSDLSKFSIGFDISPKLLFRIARIDKNILESGDYSKIILYEELIDNEKPIGGLSIGFSLTRQYSLRTGFESGLYYNQKGFGWHDKWKICSPPSSDMCETKGKITHHLLEIPIFIKYSLYQGSSIKFYFKGGPSVDVLLKSKEYRETIFSNGANESETVVYDFNYLKGNNFQRFNLSITIALGTLIPMSDMSEFRLEPFYNRSLSSYPRQGDITRRFWELGFRAGIIIKI